MKGHLGVVLRVFQAMIYARVDRIDIWWRYKIAVSDRYLIERRREKPIRPRTEEDRRNDAKALRLWKAYETFLEHQQIMSASARYGVLLPSQDDEDLYEKDDDGSPVRLGSAGKARFWNEIRVAKRERVRHAKETALAITGVLGAVIALISLLK
ncbi:hypothetical protein [uncultured Castellaniella sp.]|uniref:hypothetical protein n=1 Tax=uncultured Castellaniella sp. TaxID=647907 RepID=UPI00262581CB|nr:hypothetical protein [uncultured Castellaniella sp.]